MIKKITILSILAALGCACGPQAPATDSQTWPVAIFPGDYPDPTLVRDGADYYMTHSPFYYMPGFLVWHSQDLVNWEPVVRAVPEYTGSAYAPDLIKHNGRFYLYYPANNTNYVSWADDIHGPWSEPVDTGVRGGIDPGHVVGEDGKRYLFINDGRMAPLTDDGLARAGETKTVYEGWEFPADWETEGMWLESPKFFRRGDYIYLVSAEGGTAGPPTSHMIVVARSKSVHGPWENSPHNPMVHTYSAAEEWWSKGHGTIIDDVNGNWWVVYHAYANGFHTLGRQTLLEPVEWTRDGWPVVAATATPITPQRQIKGGMELSDDFTSDALGIQWTFWKEYAPGQALNGEGGMNLTAKGTTPADARLLLTTATDKAYEITTEVTPDPEGGNRAGLMLFYSEDAYAGVLTDGRTLTVYLDATSEPRTIALPEAQAGKPLTIRITNQGNICKFETTTDGNTWTTAAQALDLSSMHHNTHGGFYALRPALVSAGAGTARFGGFTYRSNPI